MRGSNVPKPVKAWTQAGLSSKVSRTVRAIGEELVEAACKAGALHFLFADVAACCMCSHCKSNNTWVEQDLPVLYLVPRIIVVHDWKSLERVLLVL